jgi:uncharacterized membrane protein
MHRLSLIILVALIVIAVAVIAGTAPDLPARMATHFGASGTANGFSSRETYVGTMIALVVGVPVAMVGLLAWMPRFGACLHKLPNRDYWMAPERRERTLERLAAWSAVMGCALVVFLTAMHLIVVQANASTPPALPTVPFVTAMLALAAGAIGWTAALSYAFRKPA